MTKIYSHLSVPYMQADMLRSSPACSHRRSALTVGNHTGTVPSETCGSNNIHHLFVLGCRTHCASEGLAVTAAFLPVTGCDSQTYKLPRLLHQLPPPFKNSLSAAIHSPLVTFIPLPPHYPQPMEDGQALRSQ